MKLSTQEKLDYLFESWLFIEISRDVVNVPVFTGQGHFLGFEKSPGGYYCCRNYSLKKGLIVRGEKSFFGKIKEFRSSSFEEVIVSAYKSERIGKQLDLFIKEK